MKINLCYAAAAVAAAAVAAAADAAAAAAAAVFALRSPCSPPARLVEFYLKSLNDLVYIYA